MPARDPAWCPRRFHTSEPEAASTPHFPREPLVHTIRKLLSGSRPRPSRADKDGRDNSSHLEVSLSLRPRTRDAPVHSLPCSNTKRRGQSCPPRCRVLPPFGTTRHLIEGSSAGLHPSHTSGLWRNSLR